MSLTKMEAIMTLFNKSARLTLPIALLALSFSVLAQTETIERIYAVVNDQLITYSELKNTELQMTQALTERFKGEELKAELDKMKKDLLDTLIKQKLILSKAKGKNYDVGYQVDSIIKGIKQENNLASDDDLRKALAGQGIDYETWREQLISHQIQSQLVYDEIGSKIKIDNSQIMGYFRDNQKTFTVPLTLTLDAIYLPSTLAADALTAQKKEIDLALENKQSFKEIADKYSQLTTEENKARLGTFKSGELDPKLEEQAKLLTAVGAVTPWVETENGSYRLSLVERVDEHLREYKDVRADIENFLREQIQAEKLDKYIEELRRSSYIKIIE